MPGYNSINPVNTGDPNARLYTQIAEMNARLVSIENRYPALFSMGAVTVLDPTAPSSVSQPINGTFTVPQLGNYKFIGFGSCYANVASILAAIGFGIDTTSTQAQARIFLNEAGSHRALTPAVWTVNNLSAGQHTLNIHIDSSQTATDTNDFFSIIGFKLAA